MNPVTLGATQPLGAVHGERSEVTDLRGRPMRDLRVSVTDRCNLRCAYCMPEEHYDWLERDDLLDDDELVEVIGAFIAAGVRKIRFTGGEPLLRRGLAGLVARVAALPAQLDLALTTNGTHLAEHAAELRRAGLGRVTVSLDTLKPDRHLAITRRDTHRAVLAGIDEALAAGFEGTKVNTVVLRGVNDDEIVDLLDFGADRGVEVRFIEYMDVGGATRWNTEDVVNAAEILDRVALRFGEPTLAPSAPSAPARRYTTPDGVTFGIVASTSTPFCANCDRSRLTADGQWFHCLYAAEGTDLRAALRDPNRRDGDLVELLRSAWETRADQGAVDRLGMETRVAVPVEVLRADPHREMHTRGG